MAGISLAKDFDDLLTAALGINDMFRIEIDHVEFEGSMNQVEDFRKLVNKLSWKYPQPETPV